MLLVRAFALGLALAIVGACGGDDGELHVPASPDAGPADATPPVDGDLVNDAGPLQLGTELSFAEDQPSDLPIYGSAGVAGIGALDDGYVVLLAAESRLQAQQVTAGAAVVGSPIDVAVGSDAVSTAQMACSAGRCLVAWRDGTDGTGAGDLHGVIVGAGLELSTPAPLSLGRTDDFAVTAASDGFMVLRRVALEGVTLVHVGATGDLVTASAPLFPDTTYIERPVVACDATACLATAYVCPGAGGTCVRHLVTTGPDGETAEAEDHLVDSLPKQILSSGAQLAAVYDDGPGGAQLVRIDDHGARIGARVVFGDPYSVSGAFFDGVAYVALSSTNDDGTPGPGGTTIYPHMLLTRVATDGTVLLDRVGVFDSPAISGSGGSAACHDGDCLLLASRAYGEMAYYDSVVTRLHDGHALDPGGQLLVTSTPAQMVSAIASDGRDFLVVWSQQSHTGDEVRARRIGADGHPAGAGSQVVVASTTTAATALAPADDGYLFAWVDSADGKVRLAPLDVDGVPVGPAHELGAVDLEAFQYTSLGLACHAGQCLLAWTDNHVHVQRVSTAGAPVDVADVVLQPRLSLALVTVAYNRGQFAVGWVRNVQGQRDDLDVALVPEDGPLDAPVMAVLDENISYFGGPRLAPSTDGFLVMWEGLDPFADAIYQLKVAGLSADGTLGPIIGRFGSDTDYPPASPEVIVNGQDVLVAGIVPLGTVSRDVDADGRLRLLRVGAGPRLLDPTLVDVGPLAFRWDPTVHGAANASRDVLLVRDVFSSDVKSFGPHMVGRLVRW